jgi:hypothetical protein
MLYYFMLFACKSSATFTRHRSELHYTAAQPCLISAYVYYFELRRTPQNRQIHTSFYVGVLHVTIVFCCRVSRVTYLGFQERALL